MKFTGNPSWIVAIYLFRFNVSFSVSPFPVGTAALPCCTLRVKKQKSTTALHRPLLTTHSAMLRNVTNGLLVKVETRRLLSLKVHFWSNRLVKFHAIFFLPCTSGPIISMISSTSQHPLVAPLGIMATGGLIQLRNKKDQELWEICHTLIAKVPRAYSRDYIQERVKKIGGTTIFNNFVVNELELIFKLVSEIKSFLMVRFPFQILMIKIKITLMELRQKNWYNLTCSNLLHCEIQYVTCRMSNV